MLLLMAQWERKREWQRGVQIHGKKKREKAQLRLELMVGVAKSTQTVAPDCSCQDPKASTSCLQAFSNWEMLKV